jgi:murein DD-endopeptidase MepM/ murein hydrolase activator NlpD
MRRTARHAALAGAAGAVLLVGSSSPPSSFALQPAPATRAAATAATESLGERWFQATRAALDDAVEVDMPFADLTGTADRAVAFSFEALAGQTLEIAVARAGTPAGKSGRDAAALYVEVFRVVDVLGQGLYERLTALRPGATSLRTRLPSNGTYHVLVEVERPQAAAYRLTLELGAALPFPVVGAGQDSIRSLFGARRDAGRRHHEGIDIFVQRLTPVLAVAAGRAMPGQDALGGNTVWLNTPGVSYYYAHLDRVAVRDQQPVKAGDVLGYVGNTGNARNVASHLHFGVYRWGSKPIDPLPLLVGQRFADGAATTLAADAGG